MRLTTAILATLAVVLTLYVELKYKPYPQPTQPPQPTLGTNEPTYFAEIDANGIVLRVIVADQAFIDSGKVGDPKNWIQTFMDKSARNGYAGKGTYYDKERDVFVSPKPHPDATLDINNQWDWAGKPEAPTSATSTDI